MVEIQRLKYFELTAFLFLLQFEHVFLKTALTFLRGANRWNKLKIGTKVNNSKIVFAACGIMSQITRINKTVFLEVVFYKYVKGGVDTTLLHQA